MLKNHLKIASRNLVRHKVEITQFVRLRDSGRQVFARGDRRFYEADFFYADSTFFNVFSFPLRRGDPSTALDAVNSIVLSEETAER